MKNKSEIVRVFGAGLAGVECAWQLASRGIDVNLYDIKPKRKTPAHQMDTFAELVCSNSLKGESKESASGLLKDELAKMGSIILSVAQKCRVPAGGSLAVDRLTFSKNLDEIIKNNPHIHIFCEEITKIPDDGINIIATGPLTTDPLANEIKNKLGCDNLSFFDASAPIVEFSSIDQSKCFWSGRYQKDLDYLNCPMSKEEYVSFWNELTNAETISLHSFEKVNVFEGCMPVEVLAKRGIESLRFGPMKPVGLIDPKTNSRPYAVVQLRKENCEALMLNMVGFQTNLKFSEQKRVFSMIPALKNAEYVKYGVMHRNSFINAPKLLNSNFQVKTNPKLFFAGQISGVEGYVESFASGLFVALSVYCLLNNHKLPQLSNKTIIGALAGYISTENSNFQPMNANYGIVAPVEDKVDKIQKKCIIYKRSIEEIEKMMEEIENV